MAGTGGVQLADLAGKLGYSSGGAPQNVLGYQQSAPAPAASSYNGGGGNGGYSGGGSGGYAAAPPPDLSSFDQAINFAQAGVNRLDAQRNSGFGAIDADTTNALNQLLASKNQGESTYNTNKKQTATDYVGAKNTIGSNSGSTLNSLLRLLGSKGAGGSSAYTQVAPDAVGRQATLQRADASTANAKNNQALDTNWGNFMIQYNNQVSGVNNQREQKRIALDSQINQTRGTLLQSLAQLAGQRAQAAGGSASAASAPYLSQANAALDSASRYNTSPISYQTQAYVAPELASYNSNPSAAPTAQGQAPGNDYFSPYLAALMGKKQQVA